MRRILLFSDLNANNEDAILERLFPVSIKHKIFSYMPSNGPEGAEAYIQRWKDIAEQYGAEFNLINNSIDDIDEKRKLLSSNILVISGGNTFNLLKSLRTSGLDESIKEFAKKPEFVLSGFSAGALVLTPTIRICSLPGFDDNEVGIKDLAGLHLVDFEVFPHYHESQSVILENYKKIANNRVVEISEDDYIKIDF